MHEKLNGSLSDLQSWHVRQEIIAHKEAHEDCKTTINGQPIALAASCLLADELKLACKAGVENALLI